MSLAALVFATKYPAVTDAVTSADTFSKTETRRWVELELLEAGDVGGVRSLVA
jgi:hypothetical protein